MAAQLADALAPLRDLGTPAEIRALADQGYGPSSAPLVNSHIHLPPNFSAFDSVDQAVRLAASERIGVLGISNYYDFEVYGQFVEQAQRSGIFPLFGLEIISMQDDLRQAGVKVNDPGNPGKTYLCGKGITRFEEMTTAAADLISVIRRNDSQRMALMTDRMRAALRDRGFNAEVDEQAIVETIVKRHHVPLQTVYLQERHISQAFQEALFESIPREQRIDRLSAMLGAPSKARDPDDYVTVQNELRSHLMKAGKPAFVEESFVSFTDAKRLVLELGGIPSYPVLADGAAPICQYEADPAELIQKLHDCGIHAVEWIPVRNTAKIVVQYVTKMRQAGLAVTAGTEHNTLDLIPLDPTCADGALPEQVRKIFWEGTCVVAAHQFLSLHGQRGYVDAAGQPNTEYASADERIKALARIGAAVVRRYHDRFQ